MNSLNHGFRDVEYAGPDKGTEDVSRKLSRGRVKKGIVA